MRVPLTPEALEPPPPPYTPSASDLASSAPLSVSGEPFELPLRSSVPEAGEDSIANPQGSHGFNSGSPVAYFAVRPFERGDVLQNQGIILNHHTTTILFMPSSTTDDVAFPEPVETFFNRDVSYKDWTIFKNHLFPLHIDSLPGENSMTRLDQGQQHRIEAVIAEWNKGFFSPRRICVKATFEPPAHADHLDHARSGGLINGAAPARHHRRSASMSSVSSTESSSSSSVSLASSTDLEYVPPTAIRELLSSFRADPTNIKNLCSAITNLRYEYQAQAKNLPPHERKNLRKAYKNEHKELRTEFRLLMKEARRERRQERTFRREGDRAERKEARKARKHDRRGCRQETKESWHCSQPHAERQLGYGQARSQMQSQSSQPPQPPQPHRRRSGFMNTAPVQRRPQRGSAQGTRYIGGVAQGLGQWVRAAEAACGLAEWHANDAARRLDGVLEDGGRRFDNGFRGL